MSQKTNQQTMVTSLCLLNWKQCTYIKLAQIQAWFPFGIRMISSDIAYLFKTGSHSNSHTKTIGLFNSDKVYIFVFKTVNQI